MTMFMFVLMGMVTATASFASATVSSKMESCVLETTAHESASGRQLHYRATSAETSVGGCLSYAAELTSRLSAHDGALQLKWDFRSENAVAGYGTVELQSQPHPRALCSVAAYKWFGASQGYRLMERSTANSTSNVCIQFAERRALELGDSALVSFETFTETSRIAGVLER